MTTNVPSNAKSVKRASRFSLIGRQKNPLVSFKRTEAAHPKCISSEHYSGQGPLPISDLPKGTEGVEAGGSEKCPRITVECLGAILLPGPCGQSFDCERIRAVTKRDGVSPAHRARFAWLLLFVT